MTHIGNSHLGTSPVVCTGCIHPFTADKSGYYSYADHLRLFHPDEYVQELADSREWPYDSKEQRFGEPGKVQPNDALTFVIELVIRMLIKQLIGDKQGAIVTLLTNCIELLERDI